MKSEDRRLPVGVVENNNYKISAAIQKLPQPHPFIKGTPRKKKNQDLHQALVQMRVSVFKYKCLKLLCTET